MVRLSLASLAAAVLMSRIVPGKRTNPKAREGQLIMWVERTLSYHPAPG